jgi:hypothetical protein
MTANTSAKSGLRRVRQKKKTAPSFEDEIRCRAYELYEQRGREQGHDVEDWLRAEKEVTHKTRRRVA